ncbi:MAG: substrate-binding domain-containing protein [Ignavibacteriae bacterium]|nr:substrate-binding domain-containing protein [Ignavibacteriota bacterium]
MKSSLFRYSLVFVLALTFFGCWKERKETTTKGEVDVFVDESVFPVIKQQEEKFESLYAQAKVNLHSLTTREAIVRFLNVETTKVIITFRPMNGEEQSVAQRAGLKFQEMKIALDGVVLIVNKANPVESLRTTQLDSIFRGVTTKWNELGWKNSSYSIGTSIPDQNSGAFEVMAVKILHGEKFGPVANITSSADSLIEYVEQYENGLGFLSIGQLRGKDENVKILAISNPNAPDSLHREGEYFTPHQAHMYRGYYPITSEVYVYSRADKFNVGTGFVSFIASAAGQKYFLNYGLVPATMPVRLVELTKREINP